MSQAIIYTMVSKQKLKQNQVRSPMSASSAEAQVHRQADQHFQDMSVLILSITCKAKNSLLYQFLFASLLKKEIS